jgi:hypothetical protein
MVFSIAAAPRPVLGEVPAEVLLAIEDARKAQAEALRCARLSAERWRDVARMLDEAGAPIEQAACLMNVSPRWVRELLDG